MVGILAAGVLYLGLVSPPFAQAGQPNRLVEYVSTARLSPDVTPDSSTQTNIGDSASITAPSWGDILKPGTKTSGDWSVSFEQEYGMGEESGSTLGKVLQAAKYGLDKMCFTVQEAAKKLEFKYDTSEATSGVFLGAMRVNHSIRCPCLADSATRRCRRRSRYTIRKQVRRLSA